MKFNPKILILLASLFHPLLASAQVNFTEINGSILHSKYYPNTNSNFEGTIIFENGPETSLIEWIENKSFFKCIKEKGNIFLYDRSGLDESPQDASISLKNPTTAQLVTSKLMRLLEKN